MENFSNILRDPFVLIWIGSIIGHILSLYKPEFKRTLPFIKQLIPNKSDAFYFRVDFLVLPIIGAVLGRFLIDPSSTDNAIFTGLTWSATLVAMLKVDSGQKEEPKPVAE